MSHPSQSIAVGTPAARQPRHARERSHIPAIFVGLAVALLILPFLVYPLFLIKVLCFALFALAFNLLLGYCGLLSFGHAAFFGAGSYVAAYAALAWRLPPEMAVLLGTVAAAALGLGFAILAIRRQGIYLTMVTLGLAQLVYFVVLRSPHAGAEDGLQNVPRGRLFGIVDLASDVTTYFVVAAVFLSALLLIYRMVFSPFGQVLRAIRDNEPRAISLGIDVQAYKLAVFIVSAALSGLAGAMKALAFQIASLVDVHIATSGEVVLMTLVGGVGTLFGPIVGTALIVSCQNYLAGLGEWVVFLQGLVFVLSVLLFRDGIVGVLARKIGRPL
ncbi:branched-chain amino acid ABC transporter permease [Phreatobacter sp. AB_2022a]|uniref:branched-chain amino acid ABC transporter permease n=1 Tax=Phreatobacter sp. AB_2022a TaxID=3003134 RepID=UPI002287108C|nr:branched-chain amino acid ABC transporter permease [Phreatobacter sp. AB_2022a]MCZ0737314.1 branched-chain amino acid ABC transporter permease [Phreatobacter sp. AB_2022a]